MMSCPRLHSPGADLPDLLDQCVSLGEEVGDILEHWEQRVVVVTPGDLCLDHRAGDLPHLQAPLSRSSDSRALVWSSTTARRAAALEDHVEHWVRNLSRPLLVDRLGGLAVAGELTVPSLPSLAILQGLAERAGLQGEVLARAVPAYSGQMAALFTSPDSLPGVL